MKAAESEIPDAHFTVDKQNISLWPRGKHQFLLRTRSMLSAYTRICWPFIKCCLLLPTEPPPKMGSSPVLRKPCTVRAAFVILMLVLLASVMLQAILCKLSGFIMWASSFSRASQLLQHAALSFLLSSGFFCLWLFHLPHFICLFLCAFTGSLSSIK